MRTIAPQVYMCASHAGSALAPAHSIHMESCMSMARVGNGVDTTKLSYVSRTAEVSHIICNRCEPQ